MPAGDQPSNLVPSGDESDPGNAIVGHHRAVAVSDRPKCLLITWSHPRCGSLRAPSSCSRMGFARMVESAAKALGSPALRVELEHISVFRENHADQNPHYHAVLCFKSRCRAAWRITETLWDMHSVKAHAAVVQGRQPLTNALEYCVVPTLSKPIVDQKPYFTDPSVVSAKMWDKAAKAEKKLNRGAASNDEVYQYLKQRPHVDTYDSLLQDIDGPSNAPSLAKGRVSRFISNHIERAPGIVAALIARREHPKLLAELHVGVRDYLVEALRSCGECACPSGQPTVEANVDFLCAHHGHGNVKPFFDWVDLFFSEELVKVGRPRNSLAIGCAGSGKSTLADLVRLIIPKERRYCPVLESSTPFSGLQKRHLLCDCDDWRLSARVPITATLNWLEGRGFGVDVKGQNPVAHDSGPVCMLSANHANGSAPWQVVDVDAFRSRCFVSNLMTPIPAADAVTDLHRKMEACSRCRMESLSKRCERIKGIWDGLKLAEGPAPKRKRAKSSPRRP